ncbi:MAG: prepilin peptidase [Candidatus Kaiserbacteria bacterium]|nr:prepilin peptidase [Candidatus Kaiserbacteria bacterium]
MALAIILGLFGLIIGSFLNVAIIRRGTRTLSGRSGCLSCGAQLAWYDLVPILSFFSLRGRCRYCESRISIQYPLVEIATAVLFALIAPASYLHAGNVLTGVIVATLSCALVALFIAIAVYDIRHTIIPDEWVYVSALAALIAAFFMRTPDGSYLFLFLAGPIASQPLFILWLISRGTWMGLGDAKLGLAIGWLLGPVYGVTAVFFAFVIGAVIALGILIPLPAIRRLLKKAGIVRAASPSSYTMKSEVPFGPFLIASCCLLWIAALYYIPLPIPL